VRERRQCGRYCEGVSTENQWEGFYDRHAPYYDRGAFTKHTVAEVDFLLDVLRLEAGSRVLDLGCGTGRHAIELAARGFRITGVDLSSQMLAQGMVKAELANVAVEWVHADAAHYVGTEPFDAVLCLCGAAFTTADLAVEPMEHDAAILRNVHASLRPGGAFVLTTPNGYRRIREVSDADVASGAFDPVTMVQTREDDFAIGGAQGRMLYRERLYTLSELVSLLGQHGFETRHAWGGTAGRWGRRALEMDEIEMMVVATRA
jgi:SAM-dependent methyltransferase